MMPGFWEPLHYALTNPINTPLKKRGVTMFRPIKTQIIAKSTIPEQFY